MKTSGTILELNKKKAIIMTSDAGFITIQSEPGMYIGQQVNIDPKNPKLTPVRYVYSLGLTSIAVFLFILLFVIHFSDENKVYAYVSVDINPSIEFTINNNIRIIQAKSLNHDGTVLLRSADFKNMPIEKALMMLIHKAKQYQYFHNPDGNFVLIAAAAKNISVKKLNLLAKSIRLVGAKLKKGDIHLLFIQTTIAQRKFAFQNNISLGRYLISNDATQNGYLINLDQAKTEPVAILIKKAFVAKERKAMLTNKNLHPKDTKSQVEKSTDIITAIGVDSKVMDSQDNNSIYQNENSTNNAKNKTENDSEQDITNLERNNDKNGEGSLNNVSTSDIQKNDMAIENLNSKNDDNKSNSTNHSNSNNSNHSNSGNNSSNSNSGANNSNSHSNGSGSSSHNNSSKK